MTWEMQKFEDGLGKIKKKDRNAGVEDSFNLGGIVLECFGPQMVCYLL
jgi:hypothetical protein